VTEEEQSRLSQNVGTLQQQIQAAQQRMGTLEQSAKDSSTASKELQAESIYELSIALEELHVANEELQVQNDDLCVARQALELERQRYQELFEFAPDGYLVTTTQGVIQAANCASEKLFNLRREGMAGKPFVVFVPEADRSRFHTQFIELATSQCITDWELSLKPRDHDPFPASISISAIYDPEGTWVGLRWLIRDISDRKHAAQMRHDAFHDSLTGLSNRALLLDRLGHLLERYQRHPDQLFALLFLDLDQFKLINDSFGHLVGDQVLMEVACRLKTCVRREDTLARLGGDEFVILLEEIRNSSEAAACAVRVKEALAIPFAINTHDLVFRISIGIALSSAHYQQPTELLRDADLAMYEAKRQGGACFQVFTSQIHMDALDAFRLEQELQQAIQRQELEVYYQPIISLSTQKLSGFEALVRWRHPIRGLLLPEQFLPVAEQIGLIVPIDLWVMRNACQQMAEWQTEFASMPPLMMSANLSSRTFAQSTLVATVQTILQETGFNPRCLTLEITEGVIITNVEKATATLTQLQALQVQLTIDDFGTGYSSLSRLQCLPVQGLKIDRTFLLESKGIEMVEAIVVLAHTLGFYVVSEGVEMAAQVKKLRDIGCEYAQGYYFAHPQDKESAKLKIGSKDPGSD
jgi:diguanylate cyclase (GGDEF)-like protein/PAS domain S-box-containing protein